MSREANREASRETRADVAVAVFDAILFYSARRETNLTDEFYKHREKGREIPARASRVSALSSRVLHTSATCETRTECYAAIAVFLSSAFFFLARCARIYSYFTEFSPLRSALIREHLQFSRWRFAVRQSVFSMSVPRRPNDRPGAEVDATRDGKKIRVKRWREPDVRGWRPRWSAESSSSSSVSVSVSASSAGSCHPARS